MGRLESFFKAYYWVYGLIILCFLAIAAFASKTVDTLSVAQMEQDITKIVIDAGHGGEDGGATSCTGTLESQINLETSCRLNDLLQLLGYRTLMIRTTDDSVSTTGNTIGARKISDLKNRVQIANKEDRALVVSIHQNTFSDERYDGAQVFYAPTQGSPELADRLQKLFVQSINPGSKRGPKAATGIYFMEHIQCTGILVECGFLSNEREARLLETPEYQRKQVCVIASALSAHLNP